MIICRNCSQTFNSESTEKVESVDKCPKCDQVSELYIRVKQLTRIGAYGIYRTKPFDEVQGVVIHGPYKEED